VVLEETLQAVWLEQQIQVAVVVVIIQVELLQPAVKA
jgi:hypothetical protein